MRAVAAALVVCAACGSDPKPACSLVGKWAGSPVAGNFVGERVTQTFSVGGVYEIDLNDAPFIGAWTLAGTRLTISGDSSCQGHGDGVYDLTFYGASGAGTGCDEAIYAVVSDDCMGRTQTLNGMDVTRLPQ